MWRPCRTLWPSEGMSTSRTRAAAPLHYAVAYAHADIVETARSRASLAAQVGAVSLNAHAA